MNIYNYLNDDLKIEIISYLTLVKGLKTIFRTINKDGNRKFLNYIFLGKKDKYYTFCDDINFYYLNKIPTVPPIRYRAKHHYCQPNGSIKIYSKIFDNLYDCKNWIKYKQYPTKFSEICIIYQINNPLKKKFIVNCHIFNKHT